MSESTAPSATPNPRCYFDLSLDNELIGRIVFELFSSVVPRTAHNFLSLCTGRNDKNLSYRGNLFHRVVKEMCIQGGDVMKGDGTGSVCVNMDGSISQQFEDENFELKHSAPGLLSMANAGPNTNGSQFFITTAATPHLDGRHTVFGRVLRGFEIVKLVESMEVDEFSKPLIPCRIEQCGELGVDQDWNSGLMMDERDPYPGFPSDELTVMDKVNGSNKIKELGNILFKEGKLDESIRKYAKALRYLKEEFPSPEEEKEMDKARCTLYLNEAAVLLKLGRNQDVLNKCQLVCERDPASVKGRMRMGQAYMNLGDYDLAIREFQKAQQLIELSGDHDNAKSPAAINEIKVLTSLIATAKAKINQSNKEQAAKYAKMFQ